MKILITGAGGFVGQHLMRALSEESEEITVFGTSYPQVPPPSSWNMVFLDLRKEKDVFDLVGKIRPGWIFHLAAVSNVRYSWQKRHETLQTNILGTQNLLEAVRAASPGARVLFISSADVYGVSTPSNEGFAEDDPVCALSPYAYSKAAGEMMCSFYVNVEKVDIVIARPFPHTGPGQSADFVCSDWARQVVLIERGESKPWIKVGNLDVRRDFCDVRDVVRAYLLLMKKGRSGEVYNVCSGNAVPLREILEFLVGSASKKPPVSVEVDPEKMRKTDAPLLVGNNRKIAAETGWAPRIPLSQTLQDLLSFWRS